MRDVPLITLLTDFGDSTYPAQMKGVIHSLAPHARVVDLTHSLPFADIRWAAHTLLCSFEDFPPGTVHLCVVDPGVGSCREVLLLHAANCTFVAPDNGLLWPLWDRFSDSARAFHLREYQGFCRSLSRTFHGRDVFAPLGAWIAKGVPLITLGEPIARPKESLDLPVPHVDGKVVTGSVILVDPFGNLITNIRPSLLPGSIARVRVGGVVVEGVAESYLQWEGRGVGAIVDSCGLLELFVFKGNAADLLRVGVGDLIVVDLA